MRRIAGFVLFNDSKTPGAADWCHPSNLKEKLIPHFEVFGIFEGVPLHAQMTPRPVQVGGGVELDRVISCANPPPPVRRARAAEYLSEEEQLPPQKGLLK